MCCKIDITTKGWSGQLIDFTITENSSSLSNFKIFGGLSQPLNSNEQLKTWYNFAEFSKLFRIKGGGGTIGDQAKCTASYYEKYTTIWQFCPSTTLVN